MSDVKLLDVTAPEDIEAQSMRIIESEVPEPRPFVGGQWLVVRRMIHTSADFEMLSLARFHPMAVEAGLFALRRGCTVVTDTEMARAGIPMRRMTPLGCRVECLMSDPEAARLAHALGTTRARAAVDLAQERFSPDIWVVGNAPTALLRLLELMEDGRAAPALVVGMPVGFVNAAQSKDLLMARSDPPWISISGRKGGSALAACVVNALAEMILSER